MKSQLKIITAFGLMFLASEFLVAQQDKNLRENSICGTEIPSQQWEANFQQLIKQNTEARGANKTQAQVYTIPVIIHVIHGGQAVGSYPNLAQGQINSQIQVLNNDYGGIGFNSGTYPSTAFATYATSQNLPQANLDAIGRVQIANCNIQFCLATKDTLGNTLAEPGIERINYVTKGWSNPASFNTNVSLQNYVNATIKPQTIWNVSKYLNIWVTDVGSAATLLGYATFPPLSNLSAASFPGNFFGTNTSDGFWCLARAFGSQGIFPSGTYMTGYTRGRTSTHEIGHYLGLRHTWGDGTCATDYCNDTPPNRTSNFGAPAYPLNATGTNSCSGAPNGSMFMNFMDYTDDPAKYMFTVDQSTRIQTAMSSSPYRKFLGTHNLCSVAGIAANPQFSLPTTICGTAAISPTNNSVGTPVPNYTWSSTGGAVFSPNNNSNAPSITFPSTGTYTVTLSAGNGTTSVVSKTITVYQLPTLVLSTPTVVCVNDMVTITASGANSYAWLPLFTVGPSINYVADVDQSFTCTATDSHGCKSIDSITVYVTECVGFKNNKGWESMLSIYPNPSHDKLVLKVLLENDNTIKTEIMDASGRVVLQNNASILKGKNELELNTESLSNGIYFLKVTLKAGYEKTLKFIKD